MMSMGLVDSALANLRGDWRRSAAAAMAILVATTSFVVLTGTVRTQQLRVTEQVADNYRSTYDILVRPHGSASDIERAEGVVRPNFLSGQYGGIALDQVQSVREVPGVEIAAPVAVLGQTMRSVLTAVDVRSVLGNQDRAMVRFPERDRGHHEPERLPLPDPQRTHLGRPGRGTGNGQQPRASRAAQRSGDQRLPRIRCRWCSLIAGRRLRPTVLERPHRPGSRAAGRSTVQHAAHRCRG